MYAFALYDKQKQSVFIARDPFGVKPLYYYVDDNVFYFASELKAFSPSIQKFGLDDRALNMFLTLSYIPAPLTIYKNIKKLFPGHLEGQMFPKVDRACMHNSLENRAPFLDSKIVKFALSLTDNYKIDGRNKKRILKDTFRDLLPEQTTGFAKKGFDVPVDYWFRQELRSELCDMFSKERLESQGIFNPENVNEILEQHIKGKKTTRNYFGIFKYSRNGSINIKNNEKSGE